MKMSKLVGRRIKEAPKDAKTVSHKFIIRGGYARPVSAGIYSMLPVGFRITQKIEKIIREEMDAIEGQEIKMPVVLPAELWEESGRYKTVGPELLRFKDRNDKRMLLGMTHEEAVVHLTRTEVNSYKQLPVMLYQIQTKYRDEARPRAGLIRVREFTMKDAYSFHTSQECLDQYYEKAHKAYENIFRRVGMKDCISIKSNPGMMGGNVSHEFMAIAECGEDTIFLSPDGSYKANREVAAAAWKYEKAPALPLEKVHTPEKKTIEEVATFLGMKPENTGKAVFYIDDSDNLIFAMIRGDFEVNESKLQNFLKVGELKFANDERIRKSGAVPGFASPLTLDPAKIRIVVDNSIAGSSNLIVGANEADHHFKNFNFDRDLPKAEVTDIATAREGDPDPVTGQPLLLKRGIEVGNIFKLGTKYSESMNCTFIDQNGKTNPMIMGCYGIGVGRTMASVIEQSSDDYGPIWPISIAPYQVHICAITQNDPNVGQVSERIYNELNARGIEVIYDDRGEKPGFMFADADLLGIPFRIITSPKNLPNNMVEFKIRGQKESTLIPLDKIVEFITEKVKSEQEKYR
ncbi:MAG TPA: proline--tRNA ligase [Lentisphaeria bacterium]|nr:MAG: proline--tRNA ligase [Lentisphaerae bacterium GWF2_50_93]HCE45717.1 proline--tRNA ligase [Lentisphaeria bacterium]